MNFLTRMFGARPRPASDFVDPDAAPHLPVTTQAPKESRLPSFRKAASARLRPRDDQFEGFRAKVRNAFSPSRPVIDGSLYSGRKKLLRALISAIEDSSMHVIIFGTRGIGKTSTLHILNAMASDARYLVHYGSCGQNVTFEQLFAPVLAEIPLLFHKNYDPVSPEIEEGLTLADLLEGEAITVPMISDALTKISGTQMLVILDEFDRIEDSSVRRSVAELIKNLSDRAAPVQLIIAGVAQNIDEIVEHIPSIRRNILAVHMPNMSREETIELIECGSGSSGMTFDTAAINRICEMALGLPYITSLLAHHAALIALSHNALAVGLADVQAALEQALEEIQLRLSPALLRRSAMVFDAGAGQYLADLARSALLAGGAFAAPGNVPPEAIELLIREFGLLQYEAENSEKLVFVDDGLPVFLWVEAAGRNERAAPVNQREPNQA